MPAERFGGSWKRVSAAGVGIRPALELSTGISRAAAPVSPSTNRCETGPYGRWPGRGAKLIALAIASTRCRLLVRVATIAHAPGAAPQSTARDDVTRPKVLVGAHEQRRPRDKSVGSWHRNRQADDHRDRKERTRHSAPVGRRQRHEMSIAPHALRIHRFFRDAPTRRLARRRTTSPIGSPRPSWQSLGAVTDHSACRDGSRDHSRTDARSLPQ